MSSFLANAPMTCSLYSSSDSTMLICKFVCLYFVLTFTAENVYQSYRTCSPLILLPLLYATLLYSTASFITSYRVFLQMILCQCPHDLFPLFFVWLYDVMLQICFFILYLFCFNLYCWKYLSKLSNLFPIISSSTPLCDSTLFYCKFHYKLSRVFLQMIAFLC